MLEQQELLWEKQSKSHNKHCHKGFSVFQPSCLSMFFMTCCHSYKHVGQRQNDLFRSQSNTHTSILKTFDCGWVNTRSIFRKLESLQDAPQGKLAKLCTVIDLLTRLPVQVWFHTNPLAHDTNFLADFNFTPASTLLILDRGFYDFDFVRLIAKQVDFITRIKSNAAFEVERILSSDYTPETV